MKFLSKVTQQSGIVARVNTVTPSSGVYTPNCDTTDIANITLGSSNEIANPTGTPTDGQSLILRLIQDGTGGRTISSWGNQYHFAGDRPPSLHSGANRVDIVEFRYRSAASRWECMSELNTLGVLGRNVITSYSNPGGGFSDERAILTAQAFVRAGRTYRIVGSGELAPTGAASVVATVRLRYTTDGSTPGTGSTSLTRAILFVGGGNGIDSAVRVEGLYPAASSGTLRVALTAERSAGPASTISWHAGTGGAGTFAPTLLWIEDVGPTVNTSS